MKVLLVTPPLLQPNAPYAALPAIAGFLKGRGVDVVQADLSLALVLELFSPAGMDLLADSARRHRQDPAAAFFLDCEADYRAWIAPAVSFLQGKAPELAWDLARVGTLPEGPHFRELQADDDADLETEFFGTQGVADRAKMRTSLFLDDVADLFRELVDPDFGFSRYAEKLAVAAPSFDPILKRLRSKRPTPIDRLVDRLAVEALERERPDFVGITVPFPGTVYGAFRVAQAMRDTLRPSATSLKGGKEAGGVRFVLGGGYVNSELRDLSDDRVFDFFDAICYDEGFAPWLGLLGLGPSVRTVRRGESKAEDSASSAPLGAEYQVVAPDYAGLDLGAYLSLAETANPMNRIWSDGRWLKLQLANGCYWHKCAFCDVALDYIGCYRAPDPTQAVDAILETAQRTGLRGFHFTDEALAPALVRGVCEELLRRGERIVWWGNVRLDKGFDAELADLMARAGCIAVTAGLECANDRLLKLMRKGITVASARKACRAFAEAGILVHVYLMYGFPTETEEETLGALETVRSFFEEGIVQSAFWHRFALTVHSPIAREPEAYGITLAVSGEAQNRRRFALNEISYQEPGAPDLDHLGEGLRIATYNYMRGQGLDLDVRHFFS